MAVRAQFALLRGEEVPRAAETSAGLLELVKRRVCLLVERRSLWLCSQARQAHAQTLSAALDDRDAELRFREQDPASQALGLELSVVESALEGGDSPLSRVVNAFGLAPSERDMLEVCLAAALEPRLAPAFARLRDDPEQQLVSEALVAELTGRTLPLLAQDGALFGWNLVRAAEAERGAPRSLVLDPFVFAFVCEQSRLDPVLVPFVTPLEPVPALPGWPVRETVERTGRAIALGTPVRIVIRGPRGSGRASFAASVAAAFGRDLLALDTTAVQSDAWADVFLRVQRQARLTGDFIAWRGSNVTRRPPSCLALAPVQFVTGDVDLKLVPERRLVDDDVSMPLLSVDERMQLFERMVPEAQAWGSAVVEEIATRYRVQIGDIVAVGRRGIGRADEAREACRAATRHRLGELGQQLDCPFSRADLMLSPRLDALVDDLLYEARERVRFWESPGARRLFPRGRGLVALMAGPPGTGKTMASQVIAAELGLDLFRIDLASVVNKYIGETAKNLRQIFARASEMSAVLLFDEADALFSKRTEVRDAHDRYANADTNYLLQLLEDFEGVALLASNKMGNIDLAFTRRIRYVLDFRPPEAAERLALWRRIVAELAGADTAERIQGQLQAAADFVELSGAQIKAAALASLLVARRRGEPLKGAHLVVGLQRELGKSGRAVGERERLGIERHDR